MQYDFIGIGDIVTDAFIKLHDWVHEQVNHDTKELCLLFGGKIPYEDVVEVKAVGNGPNATVAAARFGLKTALITYMGEDTIAENSIEYLKTQNVAPDFIVKQPAHISNYHYVLQFGAERTILIKHQSYDRVFPHDMEPPRWIYFSSIGPDSLAYHQEVAKYLMAHPEVKLAFQPGTYQIRFGVEALKDIYARAEIFFCNKEEAQQITNNNTQDIKVLLSAIRSYGPKVAVITDGPNGAWADDGTQVMMVPMYPDPQPPISRTGAGDSFSSTVTAMLAEGLPLSEALLRGPINSAYVIQKFGAQTGLLTRPQLEELYEKRPEDYKVTNI